MLQSVDTFRTCGDRHQDHRYRKSDNEPLTRRAGEPIGERFIVFYWAVFPMGILYVPGTLCQLAPHRVGAYVEAIW